MAKIIDVTGKGAAISGAENDSNLSTLAGINVTDATNSRTVDIDDQGATIEFTFAGAVAVTLDDIATIAAALHTNNFTVTLIATGASTVATITPDGTDSINTGVATIVLTTDEYVTIQTDGTGAIWNVINTNHDVVTETGTQTLANKTIGSGFGGGTTIAGTAATASGDEEDFAIPSWAKKITVILHSVVTTGATVRGIMVQVGPSSTPVTTGYSGMAAYIHFDDTSVGSNNVSSGLSVSDSRTNHTDEVNGNIAITNVDGNKWVFSSVAASMGGTDSLITYSASEIALAGTLDVVRVTLTATGDCDFNGGTINVLYEG